MGADDSTPFAHMGMPRVGLLVWLPERHAAEAARVEAVRQALGAPGR